MKQLLLLRHAKSSWDETGVSDHDRPLNNRGRRNAPMMGNLIDKEGLVPDLIVSSTATRTSETVDLMVNAIESEVQIVFDEALYHAAPGTLMARIRTTPDSIRTLMLVGHNPGMEELVHQLTGKFESFPTAALAALSIDTDNWSDFGLVNIQMNLLGLWKPRELEGG